MSVWASRRSSHERDAAGASRAFAIHADAIGLPRALTSPSGATVWTAKPARPYGDVLETTTPDPETGRTVVTNLRLPGQYDERLLGSVGLQGPNYNWNRWYLPSVGRYLELDPIAKAGGFNGFFGPNWYGYAEGNPLRRSDRRGLYTEVIIWDPVGYGRSSFGHVSIDINGTSYSFSPGGMGIRSIGEYLALNQAFPATATEACSI
jgi:RHS repeat-associated protein